VRWIWPPRLSLRVLRFPPRGLNLLGAALRGVQWPPRLSLRAPSVLRSPLHQEAGRKRQPGTAARIFAARRAARQSGAALLVAMLTVTLVATFAASALWQQWRGVEVESAERARVQSAWMLMGSLDWARLILLEDGRSSGTDNLSEPWAVPLNEARLSSFLAQNKNSSAAGEGSELEAFLSGQISDLQARLNVRNLIDGKAVSETDRASFARLFELLGLPAEQLSTLSRQLLQASQVGAAPPTPPTPLMPQQVEQLVWLGLAPDTLAILSPYITLLPIRTPVNLNTASVEVIYASTPGLDMSDAQKLVAARDISPFRMPAEASQAIGGSANRFNTGQHAVGSRFFEVRGRLRLDQTAVQERSVLQRDGQKVITLWRERGVVSNWPAPARSRP
jgi:general secretion pathway protein K